MIDRADPRCVGRASDGRFLARVFDPEEVRAIEAAADPDLALWLRWAAKEAAFKVVSKLSGSPPPFQHAAFVSAVESSAAGGSDTVDDSADGQGAILGGHVRYGTREIALRARVTPAWLHVLAVPMGEAFGIVEAGVAPVSGRTSGAGDPHDAGGPGDVAAAGRVESLPDPDDPAAWTSFLEARFSEAERPSIHSLPSALVRLRAREALCRRLGEEEGAVEIVCRGGPAGRTPPEVLVRGGPGRADVSLSHHGRWLGWAVTAEEG